MKQLDLEIGMTTHVKHSISSDSPSECSQSHDGQQDEGGSSQDSAIDAGWQQPVDAAANSQDSQQHMKRAQLPSCGHQTNTNITISRSNTHSY